MKKVFVAAACVAVIGSAANATVVTVFDGVAAGVSSFNNTVSAAGGTVKATTLTGLPNSVSVNAGDFSISANDGGNVFFQSGYGTLSGQVVGIDPAGGGSNPRTNPLDYFGSGLTFTFASPVNSIGFEVGDWATCCFSPTTELFISFGGGAPIKVASATKTSDGEFPSQSNPASSVFEIFVAAFDDTDDFTTVSFWGNGIGEFLVAGGQVRYALLDQGTLPPTGVVPLPAAGWLLLAGVGGLAAIRRRKST